MLKFTPVALLILTASHVSAEETRQEGSHEHGVGELNIAFEGNEIGIELHAPGADIVGFEYVATSDEDRSKVSAAVATLARPLDLFALPAEAGCTVVTATASLEAEHDEDDHEEHAHHDEHEDHDHGEEDHAEHENEESHAEFHAAYTLSCAYPAEVTKIDFVYFDTFPNALELEVQVISDRGASMFEVERDVPTLDLRNMF